MSNYDNITVEQFINSRVSSTERALTCLRDFLSADKEMKLAATESHVHGFIFEGLFSGAFSDFSLKIEDNGIVILAQLFKNKNVLETIRVSSLNTLEKEVVGLLQKHNLTTFVDFMFFSANSSLAKARNAAKEISSFAKTKGFDLTLVTLYLTENNMSMMKLINNDSSLMIEGQVNHLTFEDFSLRYSSISKEVNIRSLDSQKVIEAIASIENVHSI